MNIFGLVLYDAIMPYHPGFYILPRNEPDGLCLFQVLSRQQQQDIAVKKVSCKENKFTSFFDNEQSAKNKTQNKLIYIQLQSLRYYQPLLKKLAKCYRVKQFFNTDLSHVQQYLFTKLRIEPTSKVKVEYHCSKILEISKVDDEEQQISPPPFRQKKKERSKK